MGVTWKDRDTPLPPHSARAISAQRQRPNGLPSPLTAGLPLQKGLWMQERRQVLPGASCGGGRVLRGKFRSPGGPSWGADNWQGSKPSLEGPPCWLCYKLPAKRKVGTALQGHPERPLAQRSRWGGEGKRNRLCGGGAPPPTDLGARCRGRWWRGEDIRGLVASSL